MTEYEIREARHGDADAISRLLKAAFPGPDEAHLVNRLRDHGDITLLLVATEAEAIVGCVAFSPLGAPDMPKAELHALAPLAVLPSHQRRGLGARLTRTGLERLRASGATDVVVLGAPAYYGRFGFAADVAANIDCVWSGSNLQAIMFNDELPSGPIHYAKAFNAL